jgi:hypothetical protein
MEAFRLEGYGPADLLSHVIVDAVRITAENDGLALRFFSDEDGFMIETVAVVPWKELRAFVNEIILVGELVKRGE